VLQDVERNHGSWFARGRKTIGLDGVTLYLGERTATLAFPRSDADLETASRMAVEHGVAEIGCWALAPDERLGKRLLALGFQDGWQPHWMGLEPARRTEVRGQPVEESRECSADLPYGHDPTASDVARHFVARDGEALVGHVVLHVEGDTGGIYDMGVAPRARRQGYGTALTRAAVTAAHDLGCSSVTLNATGEGEPLYRSVGFASLGLGMTWWRFPRRPAR
jgi:ribosomal protein S18 acetylase RimI-like enzyme